MLEDEIAGQRVEVQLPADGRMVQQRLGLAGEGKEPSVMYVVEGLLAHAIAGAEEPVRVAIVDDEGEHPVEAPHAVVAPGRVGVEDRLRVATRAGLEAEGPQLAVELEVVVDLAVEDDAERRLVRLQEPLGVRAAVAQRPGHPLQDGKVLEGTMRATVTGVSGDSTHAFSPPAAPGRPSCCAGGGSRK
jgi:hypothetical protein